MNYKKDRLSELAGLTKLINEEEDPIETGERGRGKKAGKRRLFTPNVDEQEGSMNLIGKIFDKIDFANVLDRTIGMPRFGFKRGHAIPYDKFDRRSIRQIEEEVVNSLRERGEDPALFNEMTQDQADDMMRLMDKKERGERLEPHETDIILGAVGVARRMSLNLPAYILGTVFIDNDKKYCYHIIDPDHAEAPTKDLSFLAGSKSSKKVLSKTPYPIKPGSPVGDAAIVMIKQKENPDLAALQAAMEGLIGFDGDKAKLDDLVDSGDLKKVKISGGLSRWAIDNYGSALDDLVKASAADPKMSLMVGKDKNHAGYYMGDYIRYLNSLEDKRSDGQEELYVPTFKGLNLSEAKIIRESLLAGKMNLVDLIKEESTSLFQALASIGELTGDPNLKVGAQEETPAEEDAKETTPPEETAEENTEEDAKETTPPEETAEENTEEELKAIKSLSLVVDTASDDERSMQLYFRLDEEIAAEETDSEEKEKALLEEWGAWVDENVSAELPEVKELDEEEQYGFTITINNAEALDMDDATTLYPSVETSGSGRASITFDIPRETSRQVGRSSIVTFEEVSITKFTSRPPGVPTSEPAQARYFAIFYDYKVDTVVQPDPGASTETPNNEASVLQERWQKLAGLFYVL